MNSYTEWTCPFCGNLAAAESSHKIICVGKSCSCGAIALAAPAIDRDEIIDDALNIYQVKLSEKAKGYDEVMIQEMLDAGIEIKEGELQKVADGPWGEYISMWFKAQRFLL